MMVTGSSDWRDIALERGKVDLEHLRLNSIPLAFSHAWKFLIVETVEQIPLEPRMLGPGNWILRKFHLISRTTSPPCRERNRVTEEEERENKKQAGVNLSLYMY